MVDVSHKHPTVRIALAEAVIKVTPEIMNLISKNSLKKGDVFAVARIAGITASKKTSDLIPLCHNIMLSDVKIQFRIDKKNSQIYIYARVKTHSTTGVEMEALTACSTSALTIYDMCKAVSHDMTLGPIKLLGKSGGKEDFGQVEFEQIYYGDTNEI
uniref:cyclic pyranopterin monophosphate synthase n=1 Tax=Acrobeloides nanus TaxID=290746 RepID=A0A914D1Y8_9BILA